MKKKKKKKKEEEEDAAATAAAAIMNAHIHVDKITTLQYNYEYVTGWN